MVLLDNIKLPKLQILHDKVWKKLKIVSSVAKGATEPIWHTFPLPKKKKK